MDVGEGQMAHSPLYLSGDAFSVWSELSEVDQENEAKVKACLQQYFSMLIGEANAKFGRRRKRVDESIEAYLADLRRLLRMAGHKIADDGKTQCCLSSFWSPCSTATTSNKMIHDEKVKLMKRRFGTCYRLSGYGFCFWSGQLVITFTVPDWSILVEGNKVFHTSSDL